MNHFGNGASQALRPNSAKSTDSKNDADATN